MKSAIDSFTKNSLKVAAVTSLAIGACFVPGKAEAFNIVPVKGSLTRLGNICNTNQCNIRSDSTGLFNFDRFNVDRGQKINFITTARDITVFVNFASTFKGTLVTDSRKNLVFTSNSTFTFENAFYDLNGGRYGQSGSISGRPRAVPENPAGSLLGAGAVGAILLLKGRRRFKRLAQPKMTVTPEHE